MVKRLLMMAWWRARLAELAVAIVLAIGVIYFTNLAQRQYRSAVPPDVWFAVVEVFVPDHEPGSNPSMTYDRAVRQPFTGFRVVEVQREEEGGLYSFYCQSQSIAAYDPETITSYARTVKWDWFVGPTCDPEPGKYRLRITWTIHAPGWPEKSVAATSNIFTVGYQEM